jgi:hypothetical protein
MKTTQVIRSTAAAVAVACLAISGCTKKAEPTAAGGGEASKDAAGGNKKVLIGFVAKSLGKTGLPGTRYPDEQDAAWLHRLTRLQCALAEVLQSG